MGEAMQTLMGFGIALFIIWAFATLFVWIVRNCDENYPLRDFLRAQWEFVKHLPL